MSDTNITKLGRTMLMGITLCAAGGFSAAQAAADNDSAQIARGKQDFQQCIACHSTVKGQEGVGPSLAGVFGTVAGTQAGYRFSGPMKRSHLTLDAETLDKFLENPQEVVPGTRMPFSGIPDPKERQDIIKYIESLK